MGELRDFVHINDSSLNSHLSSLGKGVPSEVVESSEGQTEKSGQGGATIMGYGLKGEYGAVDRSAIETSMEITAPYRFQNLLYELEEQGVDVHRNPDPRSLDRGDVVRIRGTAKPMSLFKFEVTVSTVRELINSETKRLFENLEGASDAEQFGQVGQFEVFQNLIRQLTGDKIPLRLVTEDWSYGVALDREDMRHSPARAFVDEREYVLFGRVEERILKGNSWDPIVTTNVIDRYLPEHESVEEFRDQVEQSAEEVNMSMDSEDWELPGHTATISPIAMFW